MIEVTVRDGRADEIGRGILQKVVPYSLRCKRDQPYEIGDVITLARLHFAARVIEAAG
jgi:hypothetical protein